MSDGDKEAHARAQERLADMMRPDPEKLTIEDRLALADEGTTRGEVLALRRALIHLGRTVWWATPAPVRRLIDRIRK